MGGERGDATPLELREKPISRSPKVVSSSCGPADGAMNLVGCRCLAACGPIVAQTFSLPYRRFFQPATRAKETRRREVPIALNGRPSSRLQAGDMAD
jgi:hypothetical protein